MRRDFGIEWGLQSAEGKCFQFKKKKRERAKIGKSLSKIQGQPPLRKLVRKGPGFGDKTKTQLSKVG